MEGRGGRRPQLRGSSHPRSILPHGDDTDVIHDVMEKDAVLRDWISQADIGQKRGRVVYKQTTD